MKHRLLGGVLLAATSFLVIDWLTGAGRPSEARARESATREPPTASVAWQDVSEVVARLARTEHACVAEELEHVHRDLFVPTPLVEAAFVGTEPAVPDEAPEPEEDAAAEPDFRTRHKLVGVVVGRRSLAVIDDRLLPVHSELDGHVLIEVHRDYVIFREPQTGARITLELEQGP